MTIESTSDEKSMVGQIQLWDWDWNFNMHQWKSRSKIWALEIPENGWWLGTSSFIIFSSSGVGDRLKPWSSNYHPTIIQPSSNHPSDLDRSQNALRKRLGFDDVVHFDFVDPPPPEVRGENLPASKSFPFIPLIKERHPTATWWGGCGGYNIIKRYQKQKHCLFHLRI